ncbi:MAG: T9SS type A sorting domain-containing protein [Patescibacteria group bacterium]
MFGFIQTASAQTDGWNKEFSSMIYDTLYISDSAGAAQGNWFVRTNFLGDDVSDQVVWAKGGFDVPFEGTLAYKIRAAVNQGLAAPQVKIVLSHCDTVISSEFVTIGEGAWGNVTCDSWSGTLSKFDSIAIVERYHPWTTEFVEQTLDFDNFKVYINGQDSMFYDGGELGKVEGVVYHDKNQSGSRDEGEEGLIGWKMYLVGTSTDSVETDAQGHYCFSAVSRGTYTLKTEDRGCWVQTIPTSAETSIVVSTDTLYHTAGFGKYPFNKGYYPVQKGWNMVSLPRIVADQRKTILFPTAISNAFKYVSGSGYQKADSLRVGVGYWLKFAGAESVMIVGDTIAIDTMEVQEGWNMVGATTATVAVGEISAIPAEMLASDLFGYKDGYSITDSLWPSKGYWVKVDRSGSLVLGALPLATSSLFLVTGFRGELPPPPPSDGEQNPSTVLGVPTAFQLEQNYPNPFNPVTTIAYAIPNHESRIMNYELVTLKVYNLLGQEMVTLVNEVKEPGSYKVNFDGSRLTSGIYFYRLQTGDKIATQKMVLVK